MILYERAEPSPKWLQRAGVIASSILWACVAFHSSDADAFFTYVDKEHTADTVTITGLPSGDIWEHPVSKLSIFSKYTGARGAACLQPREPLKTSEGYRFVSPTLANINLLPEFKRAIGCGSPLQDQMLALELMYETEDKIDFLSGKIQMHGLDTKDTIIYYCNAAIDVAFLHHETYQDLVIWGYAQRGAKKYHEVDEPPGIWMMIVLGLLFITIRGIKL